MCTDPARTPIRAALAAVTLAAASAAAGPAPTAVPPAPQEPQTPYAHNEQGNFRVCAADAAPPADAPAAGDAAVCPGDFDRSGALTSRDISEFVRAWMIDAAAGTTVTDFDGDQSVTSADLSAFLSEWLRESAAGGC